MSDRGAGLYDCPSLTHQRDGQDHKPPPQGPARAQVTPEKLPAHQLLLVPGSAPHDQHRFVREQQTLNTSALPHPPEGTWTTSHLCAAPSPGSAGIRIPPPASALSTSAWNGSAGRAPFTSRISCRWETGGERYVVLQELGGLGCDATCSTGEGNTMCPLPRSLGEEKRGEKTGP